MERLQGHCLERWVGLRSRPPLQRRKLERGDLQACLILGRGI